MEKNIYFSVEIPLDKEFSISYFIFVNQLFD